MNTNQDLKKSLRRYRKFTALFCVIGFTLSYYALHVETSKLKDENYKAMCDISESISCSSVFTSEYGKGFGILGKLFGNESAINQPNGVYGLVMYPVFLLCSCIGYPFFAAVELFLGISGVGISGYLAYILFYILKDTCVVCITTYVANLFLFICAYLNYRTVKKFASLEKPDDTAYNSVTKKRV